MEGYWLASVTVLYTVLACLIQNRHHEDDDTVGIVVTISDIAIRSKIIKTSCADQHSQTVNTVPSIGSKWGWSHTLAKRALLMKSFNFLKAAFLGRL